MTWFGSSFSSLKDQLTTLTKEVLTEVDEEKERPKFIPVEKFNRLLRICEEKEEQLCELQQEVDVLRNRLGFSTFSAEGDSPPILEGESCEGSTNDGNDGGKNLHESAVAISTGFSQQEIEFKQTEQIATPQEREDTSETELSHHPPLVGCDEVASKNASRSSVRNALRAKKNQSAFKSEKSVCSNLKTLPHPSYRHGSEETMSNDSERSDDSLLNDFEILKSRGSSSKSSADEFATIANAPEAEVQTSTQMTRSTSTQSEFEFSLVDAATQTNENNVSHELKLSQAMDSEYSDSTLDEHLHLYEADFDLSEEKFRKELNNTISECGEPIKSYFVRLIEENRHLRRFYQTVNQNEQINRLVERESCLEECLKLKDSSIIRHVNELNTYSKKLENFYSSLSEVSDELVDQNVELNCLYKELKSLHETKDRLQKENTELSTLLERSQEVKHAEVQESVGDSLKGEKDNVVERELREFITVLDERNETMKTEYDRLKECLSSTTQRLEESQSVIHVLNDELEGTRQALVCREELFLQQINSLRDKIGELEHEANVYAKGMSVERQKREALIMHLKQQLDDRNTQIKSLENECEKTRNDYVSECNRLAAFDEEYRHCKDQNKYLNGVLAEMQLQPMNEAKESEVQKRLEELTNENQKLNSEMTSKNQRIDQLLEIEKELTSEIELVKLTVREFEEKKSLFEENLIRVLPSLIPDTDVDTEFFGSIAAIFRLIDEYVDSKTNNVQSWRNVVSNLPIWCERVAGLKESEETTERSEQYIKDLEARIAELELRLTDMAQVTDVVVELEAKLNTLTSERDQVIASLKEKHSENLFYHSELQKVHASFVAEIEKNKEYVRQIEDIKQKLAENSNVVSELERLREHLLTVEQSYTNELVNAEERVQDLKCKLAEYEERIHSLNAAQTSVSVRANQISESLQKEVKTLTQDKEQLSIALKNCRAELQKHIQDVQNLRSALDLFHRNKDSEVFEATEKLQNEMARLNDEKRALNETVRSLQTKLEMEKKLSSEKQQLSDDLKSKTQTIEELETQLLHIRDQLKKAEEKINDLNTNVNSENKFKSDLLKNIFVRYVTSATDSMRMQTLQILSEILDFSPQEKRSLGLPGGAVEHGETKRDLSASDPRNQSLIDEFIRFIEKESDPKERRKAAEKQIVSSSSNILFSTTSSLPDIMLPTLPSHSVGHNSRYILKDVLQ